MLNTNYKTNHTTLEAWGGRGEVERGEDKEGRKE